MQIIKTRPSIIALTAAVLLTGLVFASCDRSTEFRPPRAVPEVSTVTVDACMLLLTTELPGRTSAYRTAEIRPQVSGLILKRLFEEGSAIKAGQVLYQIDPAPFQAALDSAEANKTVMLTATEQARAALKASQAEVARLKDALALAKTNNERYEEAFKDNAISAIQRDQAATEVKTTESSLRAAEAQVESSRQAVAAAQAGIQQSEATLKTMRINLGYTKMTAPISGRIGKSSVTEGAIVTAYQPVPLATIQQLDPIYVDVPQSTSELLRLKRRVAEGLLHNEGKNQSKVQLIMEDGSAYPLEGTLQFQDVTVNPSTGSVLLRVVFPNPDGFLLPGMFVRAVIQEGLDEEAILIPQQAVSRDHKGNPYALTVDAQGKVGQRMLTLDRAIDDQWLVASGLNPGDRLIVEGRQRIRPGMAVKTVPFVEKKAGQDTSGNAGAPSGKKSQGGA
ncbi:MAG: efflux RND transporter periplasmic adaptor subunit [Deltaproteobacteria bacterium]|jgi:membrane fusion protein (multidrug efflux system)|nr:efflux RND transporter periplasmic adaptor subunit [Deltaproteobacteria bacterium]